MKRKASAIPIYFLACRRVKTLSHVESLQHDLRRFVPVDQKKKPSAEGKSLSPPGKFFRSPGKCSLIK
jgi:hypothetical protein